MKKSFVLIVIVSIVLSSCVSQKKYTELEDNFNSKSQELVDTKADLMKCRIENESKISSLEQQVVGLKKDKEKTLEYVDNLTVLSKSASDNIKETLAQMGKKDEYIQHIQKAMNKKDSINLALGFQLKKVLKDGFNDEDIEKLLFLMKIKWFFNIYDCILLHHSRHSTTHWRHSTTSRAFFFNFN